MGGLGTDDKEHFAMNKYWNQLINMNGNRLTIQVFL